MESSAHPLLAGSTYDSEKGCPRNDISKPAFDQIKGYRQLQRHYRFTLIALVFSCLINLVQILPTGSYIKSHSRHALPTLYSPARSVIRPVIRKFSPAFGLQGTRAIYMQPPSAEVDNAWKSLYYTTLSITRAEAELLPNKTIPLSSSPDTGYLTGLNVFHDLHCLDSIRKAIWVGDTIHGSDADPEVLAGYRAEMHDAPHLMHCINGLRESIMCHSDLTPLSWQWSPADEGVRVYSDVAHMCRNFDDVLEWGRQHATSEGVDATGWTDGQPPEVGGCGAEDEGCGWS